MESVHFLCPRLHCGGDVDGDALGNSSAAGRKAGICLGSVPLLLLDFPTPPTLGIGLRLGLVTDVEHPLHQAGVKQPREKELSN